MVYLQKPFLNIYTTDNSLLSLTEGSKDLLSGDTTIGLLIPDWSFFLNFKKHYDPHYTLNNLQIFTPQTLRIYFQKLPYLKKIVKITTSEDHKTFLYRILPLLSTKEQRLLKQDIDYLEKKINNFIISGSYLNASPFFQKIVNLYLEQLKKEGAFHPIAFDRYFLKNIPSIAPIFSGFIIVGFDSLDNALWPQIASTIALSERTDLYLSPDPIDGFFKETIEANCKKEAKLLYLNTHQHTVHFIESLTDSDTLCFLKNILQNSSEGKTCVITTNQPTLKQCILNLLEINEIKHYDTEGQLKPFSEKEMLLQSWIEYQKKQNLVAAVNFLRQLESQKLIEGKCAHPLEKIWEENSQILQTQELTVLIQYQYCIQKDTSFFKKWPLLNQQGTYAYYIEQTLSIFEFFNEKKPFQKLQIEDLNASISLESFLMEIWTKTYQPIIIRHPIGNCPESHIWVAPLNRAYALKKDVGIFLNTQSIKTYIDDENSDENFSADIFEKSPQDENAFILKPECAFINNSLHLFKKHNQYQKLFLNDPNAAIYAIGPKNIQPILEVNHIVNPLSLNLDSKSIHNPQKENLCHLKTIYQNRFDPNKPFDDYDYQINIDPKNPILLSARTWEDVIKDPVSVWHTHILNISPLWNPEIDSSFKKQQGIFVHEWLEYKHHTNVPSQEDWIHDVQKKAKKQTEFINLAFKQANHKQPLIQQFLLKEAQFKAIEIIQKIQQNNLPPYLIQEYALPQNLVLFKNFSKPLPIKGRIDAIFTNELNLPQSEKAITCLIDFKINHQLALTPENIKSGYGLQLALYSLSLEQMGYQNIQWAILSLKQSSYLKFIDFTHMDPMNSIWNLMENMAFNGKFGEKPFNEYNMSYQIKPISTLRRSNDILEKKWIKTHTIC